MFSYHMVLSSPRPLLPEGFSPRAYGQAIDNNHKIINLAFSQGRLKLLINLMCVFMSQTAHFRQVLPINQIRVCWFSNKPGTNCGNDNDNAMRAAISARSQWPVGTLIKYSQNKVQLKRFKARVKKLPTPSKGLLNWLNLHTCTHPCAAV